MENTDLEHVITDAQELDLKNQSVANLVKMYREIREVLRDKRKEFEIFEENAKDMQARISMALRDIADNLGVDNFKTEYGTAYRNVKTQYRVGNWDQTLEWMKETGNYQILEHRVAKLATKEIHETTGQIPPGIEYYAEVEFNVRSN